MVAQVLKNSSVCRNLILSSIRCVHLSKLLSSWEMPHGYITPIKLYNQDINKNVPLVLRNEGIASWYMCGPTVYDDAHIGHASCYVKFDIIRRIMQNIFNIKVISLMGVTDIDDKIIQKSKQMNVSPSSITRRYEANFLSDMESLNVILPTAISRVTENIPLIISFCECLISKDFAYVTSEGSVYFMVYKVDPKNREDSQVEEESTIDPLKRDVRDFALWKKSKADEPSWESPWGRGRPGWHIECSAMASSAFGSFLDIHSGGMDLKFPHHANEQSQSEAYHGTKPWVNYWLHAGLLHVPGSDKMSKSLGNIITVQKFLSENNSNDFRILCLQSPYRNNIQYTQESLNGAKGLHKTLHTFICDIEAYVEGHLHCDAVNENDLLSKLAETQSQVERAFSDDFNTSQALLCIVSFVGMVNKFLKPSLISNTSQSMKVIVACASYVDMTLEMLGVNIICKKKLPRRYICVIDAIINFRNEIRLHALKKVKGCTSKEDKSLKDHSNVHENEAETFIKAVDSLKTNLHAVGVNFQGEHGNLNEVLKALFSFIDEIQACMCNGSEQIFSGLNESLKELTSNGSRDIKLHKLKEPKRYIEKTSELHLLKACDNFRTALNGAKIIIKDKERISYWCPTEDFHL